MNARRSRWFRVAVAAVLTVILLPAPTPAPAAPSRAELEAARARLHELERDFELVAERYNAVHERLTSIQRQIAATELELREVEERLASERRAAVALAQEIYKSGSSVAVEAVLSARTFAEVETRLRYLDSSEKAQARIFRAVEAAAALRDAKIAGLEVAAERVSTTRNRLATARAEVEARLAEQEAEIEALTALVLEAERRARRATVGRGRLGEVRGLPVEMIKPEPATNPAAQTAVDTALAQLGKPYRWGASGPDEFDCSGLTQSSWAAGGVVIPRNSAMQFAGLPHVGRSAWEPGDLLFYGSPIHHVGMYIGNNQMVNAPYTGAVVRVNWADRPDYAGAARPGTG